MVWMLKSHDAAVIKEIERHGDRAAAILAASCLEEKLADTLLLAFETHEDVSNQMFKGYGPLGSFRAKIDLGLLLGMYPEFTHKSFSLVKDIRNLFAHRAVSLTFKTQQIKDLCNNFPPLLPRPKDLKIRKEEITPAAAEEILAKQAKLAPTAFEVSSIFGRDTARARYLLAVKSGIFYLQLVQEIVVRQQKLRATRPQLLGYWPWPLLGRSEQPPPQPPRIGGRKRKIRASRLRSSPA